MNLRHPKVIRLGGCGAGLTTLLAVAAGSYLAMTFLQAGDLLNGGIVAGMTVAVGLFGGLFAYCLFVFARMQPASAATVTTSEAAEQPATIVEMPADEDEAIAMSVANSTLPPPELSDDAMPVFAGSTTVGGDDSIADLLVVPPPIDAVDDSDSIAVERSVTAEDFDSRMDLPVRIEAPELNVEELDEVPPPVVQSQTSPVVSALTQTDEVDALDELAEIATPEPILPKPAADATKSLPDAFPDIFKSAMPKAAPIVSKAPAPAPIPVPPVPVVKKAPAAVAQPATKVKPLSSSPQRAHVDGEESMPVVDDLSDIAITLGPVTPTGVLPTEIPDFFLKMPGRSASAPAKPVMPVAPVAPVAPRQVAEPKPVHHAQAVVRIIDSTTSVEEADDLVTMTAIPDDWPS